MPDNLQFFIHSQQNAFVQAEIMRIEFHKLNAESMFSLCYATTFRPRKTWPNFFSCNHASQGKIKRDTFPELTCCMTLWMPLQTVSLLASTAAALTNRSMDLFQAQVSSNLKCMSSLLWNNHSLWGSYCLHHPMNHAHCEYGFTCFATCKFPRRLEYCSLLLPLQVLAAGIRDASCRKKK